MYHSAFEPPQPAEPVGYWTDGNSVALTRSVGEGLAPQFATCDVLYADLPSRESYDRYQARAHVDDPPPWDEFMADVRRILEVWQGPAVIRARPEAQGHLPWAVTLHMRNTYMPGVPEGLAYFYGITPDYGYNTDEDLLRAMAFHYERVGDFTAGYGTSARAFVRAGHTFVASDINPECVGYIAEHAEVWASETCSLCKRVPAAGMCCGSHGAGLCHRCYRASHFVDICGVGCVLCQREGLDPSKHVGYDMTGWSK